MNQAHILNASGLQAFMPLQEGSGLPNIIKAGSQSLSAPTAYGSPPSWITGIHGKALQFTGIEGFHYEGASWANRNSGDELTVAIWFRNQGGSGYQDIITNRSIDGAVLGWLLYKHETGNYLSFHGDSQNLSSYLPPVGKWIRIVVTVTSDRVMTIYVNGVVVFQMSNYYYFGGMPSGLSIGSALSGAERLVGDVGAWMIFSRAWGYKEVQADYFGRRGAICS